MAEPGDPSNPDDHDDDLIGFASPASLQGRARDADAGLSAATPGLRPVITPAFERAPIPAPEPEADLFATPADAVHAAWSQPAAEAAAPEAPAEPAPAPRPVGPEAAAFGRAPEGGPRRRGRDPASDLPGGGMGLYAAYALILFAVPTVGVSAVIGLLAMRQEPPTGALAASHFLYQQRTLRAAGIAALAGLVLLALPFALGVPILFLLALWIVLRGASGVWLLKSGRPIENPRGWWI
ncbi:MAG TPA: hypothetical protein VFF48_07685 [Brevundimonas sp.]|nr:hypothetical protein [Brevundimonas sp.]